MNTRYRKHADLRLTALEGEGVALHLGSRRYFTVTETGLSILQAITSPKSFDEIVAAIIDEYDVDQSLAESSVRAFLDRCVDAALIEEIAT